MADQTADYGDIVLKTPRDGVLQITLNRPEVLNALRSKLIGEVRAALAAAAEDDAVRAVVVTGNERAFAAGAIVEGPAHGLRVECALCQPQVQHLLPHGHQCCSPAMRPRCSMRVW